MSNNPSETPQLDKAKCFEENEEYLTLFVNDLSLSAIAREYSDISYPALRDTALTCNWRTVKEEWEQADGEETLKQVYFRINDIHDDRAAISTEIVKYRAQTPDDLLMQHKQEWFQHRVLEQDAYAMIKNGIKENEDHDIAREKRGHALIRSLKAMSEQIANRQKAERKAWGLDDKGNLEGIQGNILMVPVSKDDATWEEAASHYAEQKAKREAIAIKEMEATKPSLTIQKQESNNDDL